jgi:hypothetical protein
MNLPDELCREAARLLQQRYRDLLAAGESFSVTGSLDADQAEVTVHLDAPGGHDRLEWVVRVAVPAGADDADSAVARALDAGDAFIGEWLEGGRAERHPIDFVEHRFAGRPVSIRMRHSRPALEAEAERILQGARGEGEGGEDA